MEHPGRAARAPGEGFRPGPPPVFIVGTERSGSNLLRLMLDAHPEVAVPHPPHILHYLSPLEPRYGDLRRPQNLGRLVDDVLTLIRLHIHPWEANVLLDRERLLREAWPRDLCGVFIAVYEAYRRAQGKARWGCKSTFLIHHVARLRRALPGARFLWLVRDPRDVAASSRRSVFSPFHPWHTAELWRRQQEEGLAQERALPASVWLRLRYEDLLADPQATLQRVCAFLDLPPDPGMLAFHARPAAQRASALSADWRNTARPLLRGNSGKFRAQLSPAELRWVEASCGPLMQQLGYPPLTRPDGARPGPGARARFAAQGLAWRAQVELRSLRQDNNHWRRWRRGAWVAAQRLRACGPGPR